MPQWERFFYGLDSLRQQTLDFFGLSPASAFRLHTADVEGVLVADDASMVSLIALEGCLRLVGEAEFEEAASRLEGLLASPLASRAHALQLVFTCDPAGACPSFSASWRRRAARPGYSGSSSTASSRAGAGPWEATARRSRSTRPSGPGPAA